MEKRRKEVFFVDMMNGIAATAMSLSAAKLSVDYSTAVTKKAMDSQEAAVQQLLEMLPEQPPMGKYIDTYA